MHLFKIGILALLVSSLANSVIASEDKTMQQKQSAAHSKKAVRPFIRKTRCSTPSIARPIIRPQLSEAIKADIKFNIDRLNQKDQIKTFMRRSEHDLRLAQMHNDTATSEALINGLKIASDHLLELAADPDCLFDADEKGAFQLMANIASRPEANSSFDSPSDLTLWLNKRSMALPDNAKNGVVRTLIFPDKGPGII